jgi:DNA-directed RNA polymerase delta subunit
VSAERNFSCLKRIKTYLRNSMCQERLSELATLSIEKELLTELSKNPKFYDDIIDKFANLKEIYKK